MENDDWKWNGKNYQINYNWDDSWARHWRYLNEEEKNTIDAVDNVLTAMDMLECLVDDSANQDAVRMLAGIGIRC